MQRAEVLSFKKWCGMAMFGGVQYSVEGIREMMASEMIKAMEQRMQASPHGVTYRSQTANGYADGLMDS